MITREQIAHVLDHPVHDGDGNKIGDAKHVYLDDVTGLPEFVTVKTGLFGSHETFVPTREASVVRDHIQVPYRKDKVKGAPHIDVDAGGHLSENEEHRLYDYYGLDWNDAAGRRGGRVAPGTTDTTAGTGGTAAAGRTAAGTGAGAGTGIGSGTGTGRTAAGGAAAGAGAGTADAAARARAGGRAGERAGGWTGERAEERVGERGGRWSGEKSRTGMGRDEAMTRSEERLHVGVESREVGRARLRKYVVTEEVEQTVPLRHDEVRVEREPITDANRDAALSGPEIGEDEYEVVLHEERPVVETETVPVERVRLTTEEHISEETVRARVRKEHIKGEAEGFEDDRGDMGAGDDIGPADDIGSRGDIGSRHGRGGRDGRDGRGDTGRGRRL